jgi:PAS domain S-box-containing protein
LEDIKHLTQEALWWVADAIRGSVVIIDKAERVVFANTASYAICGIDRNKQSMIGWSIEEMFSYTGFSRDVSPIVKSLHTGKPHLNVRVSTDLGEYVIDATPVLREGQTVGAVALGYNISDLVNARQELFETAGRLSTTENQFIQHRETLQWFIESSPLAIVTVDRDGYITSMNEAQLRLLGLAEASGLLGKPYEVVLSTLGVSRERSLIYRALSGAGTTKERREFAGRFYDVLAYTITHPVTGDIVGAISVASDITERIRMDSELLRLDRLNLVGEMAASIAHEIRNPMTTVRGFLQLLSNKPELEKYTKYTTLMIEELDRANSIITTYLSLSGTSIERSLQDLSELISSFSPILDADATMHNTGIEYSLLSTARVMINAAEIKQLLANLVKNALEASPQGTVKVSTRDVPGGVLLEVEDNGTGILPEVMSKLGTPFLTTKAHGTGLGLAVCYRIADRHNSTILAENLNPGCRISIIFR